MTITRIGSLCSGYGGLDMAATALFPKASIAWHAEVAAGPSKILSHHWPSVPNLGDLTLIDWATVEPVQILTAGYPCQPFSAAGKRKGTNDERHLWPIVRTAIRVLRPRIVLLENVAGHRSLGFDRVLGDLAEDGLHARWTSLRASDIGAPHHRERLFIMVTPAESARFGSIAERFEFAEPADSDSVGVRIESVSEPERCSATGPQQSGTNSTDADSIGRREGTEQSRPGGEEESTDIGSISSLPDAEGSGPSCCDGIAGGGPTRGSGERIAGGGDRGISTPDAECGGRFGREVQLEGASVVVAGDGSDAADADGTDGVSGLERSVGIGSEEPGSDGSIGALSGDVIDWGPYGPAIERWESITRVAPAPVELNRNGKPRLNAAFAEWMMGIPGGWVSDFILRGTDPRPTENMISRSAGLKAIGDGVVPQQAFAAYRFLISLHDAERTLQSGKECAWCGTALFRKPKESRKQAESRKFCSLKCMGLWKRAQ